MLANNLKAIIYYGAWYFIVFCFLLMDRIRVIFERMVPMGIVRILILGVATLIFSSIFTWLFMRPTGGRMAGIRNNFGLIIMDIGVMLAAAIGFTMKAFTLLELVMVGVMLLLQLMIVFAIMRNKEENYYE